MPTLLITGICGFAGSVLARELVQRNPALRVIGLDNFSRNGSFTNREPLRKLGIQVVHGDVRNIADLDITNAFKAYRAEVIAGCRPFLSPHFNLTVEMPLKAIVRGFNHATVPITWRNRRAGEAKLKIKEMGSRYLFICLYVWLEKYFSRGDYRRSESLPKAVATTTGRQETSSTPTEKIGSV